MPFGFSGNASVMLSLGSPPQAKECGKGIAVVQPLIAAAKTRAPGGLIVWVRYGTSRGRHDQYRALLQRLTFDDIKAV